LSQFSCLNLGLHDLFWFSSFQFKVSRHLLPQFLKFQPLICSNLGFNHFISLFPCAWILFRLPLQVFSPMRNLFNPNFCLGRSFEFSTQRFTLFFCLDRPFCTFYLVNSSNFCLGLLLDLSLASTIFYLESVSWLL